MGKRSNKGVKMPRDFWPTVDPDAFIPLRPYISGKTYAEPCCGNEDLIKGFEDVAYCGWASDISIGKDATTLTKEDLEACDVIITNPPFSWEMLKPLLDHLPKLKPTWLLLPADFMHNKRSAPYMVYCSHIVAVRRLFWWLDEGDLSQRGVKGKDNYCWYLFHDKQQSSTNFIPRF